MPAIQAVKCNKHSNSIKSCSLNKSLAKHFPSAALM